MGNYEVKEPFSTGSRLIPILVVAAAVLALTGRYLFYGVPHEFLTGEYKGTFEGDYDFTLELVRSVADWGRLPLWSDTYSGPIAVFASNFHVFEQALLYPLTGNLAVSIKILQALQLLVAGLGMYTLSSYLFKDRIGAAFSAVLYMFTPFYIGHLLSYLHYTGVYLLAPLVFYLILRTLAECSWRHALLVSLISAYSLLSHPQNVFIGGLFYALFFCLVAIRTAFENAKEGQLRVFLKKAAQLSLLIVTVTFLLSAFITLPTLIDNYPYLRTSWVKGAAGLIKVDHGHIGAHSQSILATITLQHWPWFQTPIKGGVYPAWQYMTAYALPFTLAAISIAIRFNWLTAVFLFMTAISVQIALGVNGTPDLFALATRYIPFLGMSRTPYSYVNIAILVFCLLSSVTFTWLCARLSAYLKTGLKQTDLVRWAVFAALLVPYLMAARYYGNDYNWTFISSKQPEYFSQVWRWMGENNGQRHRVIETCGIPTAMILGQRMLPNQVELLERFEKKAYLADYLALLGFKYVITPSLHSQRDKTFDTKGYMVPSVFDRKESMEEYYSALTTEYYHVYERLSGDDAFRLHTAGTKDVAIFENRKAFSGYEIYQARPVMVFGGTDSYDLLSLDLFREREGALKPAPLFMAQSENLKRLDEIKGVSDDVVLHNLDSLDLFLYLKKDALTSFRPAPVDPENWSLAIHSFGIQQPFSQLDHSIGNSLFGELTFSDFSITARQKGASLSNVFEVRKSGTYRIMLRSYGGADYSDLQVNVNGIDRSTVVQAGHNGYGWVTLFEGALERGMHTLQLTTLDDRPVYIDTVFVVDPSVVEAGSLDVLDKIGSARSTYIANHRRFSLSGDAASTTLHTGAGGRFTPSVRIARFKKTAPSGRLSLLIDGAEKGFIVNAELKDVPVEFTLPSVALSPGRHSITVKGLSDGVYFDLISLSKGESQTPEAGAVSFDKTGPSSYSFHAPSSGPRFVVFNESHYPGWSAKYGGGSLQPVVTNMFMSGFVLPDANSGAEFKVEYSNRAQNAGLFLSGLTVVGILTAFSAGAVVRKSGRRGA